MASEPVVVKYIINETGDILRMRLQPPLTMEKLKASMLAAAARQGAEQMDMRYKDDEGDLCTLDVQTFADFEWLNSGQSVVRVYLVPKGHKVAPAEHKADQQLVFDPPSRVEPNNEQVAAEEPAVHKGVICDASDMDPIVGARYKKRGEDYDLCEAEFMKLPEEARFAFIRIDHPDHANFILDQEKHEAIKNSAFASWMDQLKASLPRHLFQELAATIQPVLRCPKELLLPCLEQLQERASELLKLMDPASALAMLPDCVADIMAQPERFAEKPAIHHGVECDASGMCPIVGTRYKKRGENYDLCEAEFLKLPVDSQADYIAMSRPSTSATVKADLKNRHGWDDVTITTIKDSYLAGLIQQLRSSMPEQKFEELARSIEPVFGVPRDCVEVCLFDLQERLTAMLDCMEADVVVALLPDCIAEVVANAKGAGDSPPEKLTSAAEAADGVCKATGEVVEPSAPAESELPASVETQELMKALAGEYKCRLFDETEEGPNDWHFVKVSVDDIMKPKLVWTNRAGVSWTLRASAETPLNLQVGPDCPYFETGHTICEVKYDDAGRVVGLLGPHSELYDRVNVVPTETIPNDVAERPKAAIMGTQLGLGGCPDLFEDVAAAGDVTQEFSDLLSCHPDMSQAYRLGRIAVPAEAGGDVIVKAYVKNDGDVAWPAASAIYSVAGPAHGFCHMPLGPVPAGDTIELALDLKIQPGEGDATALSAWAICDESGKPFGPLMLLETFGL